MVRGVLFRKGKVRVRLVRRPWAWRGDRPLAAADVVGAGPVPLEPAPLGPRVAEPAGN